MDVTDRYLAMVNDERWDELAEVFAPEARLIAPGARPRRGLEEIRDYYERAFAPYPEHTDLVTRKITSGRTTVAEISFAGRTDQGATVEFDAVDVFDVDERGLIVKLSSWYDSLWVRKLLSRGAGDEG